MEQDKSSQEALIEAREVLKAKLAEDKAKIKEYIQLEQFLYNNENFDLGISESLLRGTIDRLATLSEDLPILSLLPVLGHISGQLIEGETGQMHAELREKMRSIAPPTNPWEITDISGFVLRHESHPDIPIITFSRAFRETEKQTFTPLFQTLKDQHALVIDEELQEVPLP